VSGANQYLANSEESEMDLMSSMMMQLDAEKAL
jgi:hypothetical protein